MSDPRRLCRDKTSGAKIGGIDDSVVMVEKVIQRGSKVFEVFFGRSRTRWNERHVEEDVVGGDEVILICWIAFYPLPVSTHGIALSNLLHAFRNT